MSLISVSDLKSYLGLTTTGSDTLLGTIATAASAAVERDTGRVFAVSSNVTRRYSTNGASSLVIADLPYTDATRLVTWNGVTLVQDTNYWLLPDRRNPDVASQIQLRYFSAYGDWFKADPAWWDKNLDVYYQRWAFNGAPNDLVITGVWGHPTLPQDVFEATLEYGAWMYYRSKAGAGGTVTTVGGNEITLGDYPPTYQRFVHNWTLRTAVAVIG